MNYRLIRVSLTMLALLSSGLISVRCTTDNRRYPLRGQILQMNQGENEITVKHEEIVGYMAAMTMPFKVRDSNAMQKLKPGDQIIAELVVGKKGAGAWLEHIQVVKSGEPVPRQSAVQTHPPATDEFVPDIPLTNQDGRIIRLRDFKGKAVLVTFVYTRCPLPNFCPLVSKQFAKIHKDLAQTPDLYRKTHLLTISIDPAYDTAPVLRRYGLAYLDNDASGFQHWDFAYASPDELTKLAGGFGLSYFEQDGQIAHTINIGLVAPDGTLADSWMTKWNLSEVEDALRRAAANAAPVVK